MYQGGTGIGGASGAGVVGAGGAAGALAMTGFDVLDFAILGLALVIGGLLLIRFAAIRRNGGRMAAEAAGSAAGLDGGSSP
jgi:hypothetical protein